MKVVAILTLLHGAIHLLGFGKAFGLFGKATTPIRVPVSKPMGLAWLLAAVLLVACGILSIRMSYQLPWQPAGTAWLAITSCAVVLSQVLIVTTWRDAKFGTIANLVIVVPLVFELLELRATSFRSTYLSEIATASSMPVNNAGVGGVVTEQDIAPLPPPLQRYLRRTGALGQPRATNIHVHWRGEIKRDPKGSWMSMEADQYEQFGSAGSSGVGRVGPSRYFLLYASQYGVPFQSLHRYVDGSATMSVRVGSTLDVVLARGEKMTQSETVTLFNDMCMLAPSSLIDATLVQKTVSWTTTGTSDDDHDRRLRGTFRNAGHTITADLIFDGDGDLVDFISENSRFLSADGKTYEQLPWSTPLRDYRDFGAGYRVASRGDAIWKRMGAGGADFTYARFEVVSLEVNIGASRGRMGVPNRDRNGRLSLSQ